MTKNQQVFAKMGGGSLALLLSLSLGQQASALTLVENLTQSSGLGSPTVVEYSTWQATSFTTGSGSYNLDSVTLSFRQTLPDSNLVVSLYSNNSGTPGSPITTFTNPASITNTLADNTFTLGASQLLAPNTTYWLGAGVSANATTGYAWGFTDSFGQAGLPGWTIGDNYSSSNNQGGSWNAFAGTPFQFRVDGTQNPPAPVNIPEPSSVVALLGLGGLGLASSLKKRK